MVELAVVIPYFNPAGYVSHERKLARTLAAFRAVGLAGNVHLTGAGGSRPLDAQVAFWDADCPYLWHKERLINLAVERLPAKYTHVVWSDSDVIVDEDWAGAVADAFRTAAVVQCFRTARYRDTAGRVSMTRSSALLPGERGAMGLVWGADRALFADGPGLFEHAVVGGGDSVLGRAVRIDHKTPSVPWLANHRHMLARKWSPELLAAQDAWVAATARWLTDRGVAAAAADIQVLEHGPRAQRRYNDRHSLLARFSPAHHLVDEPDRVLRWTPAAAGDLEPGIRAYFHSRGEDDPSRAPIPDIPDIHDIPAARPTESAA